MSIASNSSSSLGSAKESTIVDCSQCYGSCLWTAELGGPDVFGQTIYWTGHKIIGPSEECYGRSAGHEAGYQCGCRYPTRDPEFVGDTELVSCGCCKGCCWYWHFINRQWIAWTYNYIGCGYFLCPRPYCGPAPTEEPELIADKYYAAHYTGCQSTSP